MNYISWNVIILGEMLRHGVELLTLMLGCGTFRGEETSRNKELLAYITFFWDGSYNMKLIQDYVPSIEHEEEHEEKLMTTLK